METNEENKKGKKVIQKKRIAESLSTKLNGEEPGTIVSMKEKVGLEKKEKIDPLSMKPFGKEIGTISLELAKKERENEKDKDEQ